MKRNTLLTIVGLIAIMIIVILISYFTLWNNSIRLDESQSIYQAIKPITSLIPFEARDVSAPFYILLLHFWIQIFGVNIIYARILSLIFLLVSIPFFFQLCKEASNRKIAFITIILFSFSPFLLWYSNEARTYTLFTLITILNNLFFLRLIRSQGKTSKLGYFFTTVLGYYTHYFFLFFLFSQTLYVIWEMGFDAYRDKRLKGITFFMRMWNSKAKYATYFLLVIGATSLFIPWVVYVILLGFAVNTQPLIARPTSYNLFQTFSNFIFGFQSAGIESLLVSLWPLGVVGFFFIFTRKIGILVNNISYFVFITFFPIIFVFMISYIRPLFLSRYLIFVTPTLFFILVWILLQYPKRVASFLISALFGAMLLLLYYQNISLSTPVKEDYQGVDMYLNKKAQPNDIIAVSVPFTIYPVTYGYKGYARIDTIPLWNQYSQGSIPSFVTKDLQQQIDFYKLQYKNIYIVLSYSQGYEDKIIKFMDTHYQREKLVKFSPDLQVRVYRLRYE